MNGSSKTIQIALTTEFSHKEQFRKNKQTEEIQHFFLFISREKDISFIYTNKNN